MNFAIIGASGNVGRKTIEILEKSKIPFKKLYLIASKKSAGKKGKNEIKEGVKIQFWIQIKARLIGLWE